MYCLIRYYVYKNKGAVMWWVLEKKGALVMHINIIKDMYKGAIPTLRTIEECRMGFQLP